MKIARIETSSGHRAWAVVDPGAGTVRRIAGRFSEWARTAAGSPLPLEGQSLKLGDVRLLAPIEPGGRVFGVAANYGVPSGARGRGERVPHPVTYIRPDSAIVHPDQELRFPAVTRQVNLGVELVAVIARRLGDEPHATACLLGYTIGSGISARAASGDVGAPDLFSEKALDRTTAMGPWITTLDEFGGLGQPQVAITMRVNGEVRQVDNSRSMIFAVDELLDFIDTRVALQPGDLVFTGTPASGGVEASGLLQPGDRLASEIDHVGVLRNVVGPREQPPALRLADRRAGQADKPIRTPRRRAAVDRPRRHGGSAGP